MMNRRRFVTLSAIGVSSFATTAWAQQQTPITSVYIKNMHCEGCAKRLRTRLYKLPNVLKVTTNVKQGTAIITPTKGKDVAVKTVWDAAEAEKFQVVKIADKSGTHTKKPVR